MGLVTFDHQAISEILLAWFDPNVVEAVKVVQRLSAGIANDSFEILSGVRRLVLRISRASKRREVLELELRVLKYLNDSKFPYEVPRVLSTIEAGKFIEYQNHFCVLFEFCEAYETLKANFNGSAEPTWRELAHLVFTLHQELSRTDGVPDCLHYARILEVMIERFCEPQVFGDDIELLRLWQAEHQRVLDVASHLVGSLPSLLLEKGISSPELVHGDPIASNILVRKGMPVGIIDFDQTFAFVHEYDLARCVKSIFWQPHDGTDWGMIQSNRSATFLAGYAAVAQRHSGPQSHFFEELIPSCIAYANLDSIYFLMECRLSNRDKLERLRRYTEQLRWVDRDARAVARAIRTIIAHC